MNILKPSTWFKKLPVPHVFCQLSPDFPHQGLDHFSEDAKCIFKYALKVTGISAAEARIHLVGKVLNWSKLSDKHWKGIEGGRPPEITFEELKSLFL